MRRTILALALVLAVAMTAVFSPRAWAGPGDDPSQVVARVGDKDITLGELMKREPAKMLDAAYKYYQAESEVIQEAINNGILEQQAKKEHLTVDQLIDKHVRSKVKDPGDEALKVYYEGLDNTDQPYEALKDKIKEHIREGRMRKSMIAYAKSLRDSTSVVVMLAPPKEEVAIGNSPVQGSPDAAVKVVEFADYECPYCRKIEPTLGKLRKEYGNRVAFAFKDFPLPMHKHAEKAAEAARCANAQGKFWDFHDKLFSADSLEIPEMKTYARSMNLDSAKFDKCLDSGGEAAGIQKDQAEGSRLGLTGTPTLFVNGHFLSGNVSYETLQGLVKQELATGATKSASGGM